MRSSIRRRLFLLALAFAAGGCCQHPLSEACDDCPAYEDVECVPRAEYTCDGSGIRVLEADRTFGTTLYYDEAGALLAVYRPSDEGSAGCWYGTRVTCERGPVTYNDCTADD